MAWSWLAIVAIVIGIPAISIWRFANWMGKRSDLKFEEKAKAWEVFISLVSSITALVGGALLLGKYLDEQNSLQQQRHAQERAAGLRQELSHLQPKFDAKRKLYGEATLAAIRLAQLDECAVDFVKKSPDREQFEELYWARLIGVEGPEVESAMVHLRKLFERWVSTGKKPETDVHQAVLDLSKICEKDLKKLEDEISAREAELSKLVVPSK